SSGLAPCVTLCLTSPPRRSSDLGAAPVVDTPPHHQRGTGAAGPAHAAITTIGSGLAILGAVGEAGPIGAGRAIAATAIDHHVLAVTDVPGFDPPAADAGGKAHLGAIADTELFEPKIAELGRDGVCLAGRDGEIRSVRAGGTHQ